MDDDEDDDEENHLTNDAFGNYFLPLSSVVS